MIRKLSFGILAFLLSGLALGQTPTKPAVLPPWAATATPTTDIVQPTNTFISQGWPLSSTPPSRQYFNWVLNYSTNGVRYLTKTGISAWDSAETYSINDVTQNSGYIYQSNVNSNSGNTPPSVVAGINAFWDIPHVITAPLGDHSSRVANTDFLRNNYVPIGGSFTLLGDKIASSQVPLAAVSQWQSQLSINFSQLTGVPASASPIANTYAIRDGSGYLYATYFNQQNGANENPSDIRSGQVIINNSSDTFNRKASFAYFEQSLRLSNQSGQVTSAQVPQAAVTQYDAAIFNYNPLISKTANGCATLPGGVILMWGVASPNGGTITVNFPCGGFPNAVFSVTGTGKSTPTQTDVPSANRLSFQMFNTGGSSYWQAIGY